jgi:hypothetical protein
VVITPVHEQHGVKLKGVALNLCNTYQRAHDTLGDGDMLHHQQVSEVVIMPVQEQHDSILRKNCRGPHW